MSDFLTPLVEAYRAENPPQSLDARALRTRILQASARRDQSPARHLKWLIPVAAAFVGTAALAATPVARPFVTHLWAHINALTRSGTGPGAPRAHRAPAPAPPALTLAPHPDLPRPSPLPMGGDPPVTALSDLPAPARVPEGRSVAGTSHSAHRTAAVRALPSEPAALGSGSLRFQSGPAAAASDPAPPAAVASAPSSSPAASLAPDLSAYQVAHRLHFANADYAHAFVAWNGYLARFPNGTFAPEARLNRAVCLARLGRKQEARRELDGIARGRGSYALQAQRLLDAMTERE